MTQSLDTKRKVEIETLEPTEDGTLRVRIRGKLDTDSSPVFGEALDGWRSSGTRKVQLDLRTVSFMSSCGVGTLVAAVADYRDVGGDVLIVGVNAALMAVFEALDLMDYLTIVEVDE